MVNEPKIYRSLPVRIEAMQWLGGETGCLDLFLGQNWTRADARDIAWPHEDEEEIIVWNSLEKIYLPVPVGHWIIRGLKGEFYPCDDGIFKQKYEAMITR